MRWRVVLGICLLSVHASSIAADVFSSRSAPGYAQTTWASLHGDSRNSDYVPLAVSTKLQPQWLALKNAVSWAAPSIAADGTLYVTTGRGKGYSHLHALSRSGELLWASPPQMSPDDLDAKALFSAPVLDDGGNVYVSDSNQLWSFTGGGAVRWTADLAAHDIREPFLTAIIVGEYVGGVSADGRVALFDRDTGALAMPVLVLPGKPGPKGGDIPDALWGGGLMDARLRQQSWDLLRGYRHVVTNTPAVHPQSGRIYITATGERGGEGRLYGIDTEGELRIAFATSVPPKSGTSPALSPDGRLVYAVGGGGILYALNSDTGEKLWQRALGGQDASPSVGPDNVVYVHGGDQLIAVDGMTGETLWRNNYREWARAQHKKIWPRLGLVGSRGRPDAYVDGIVTVSNGLLWTTLLVGYEINLLARDFIHPVQTYLVALDPSDGTVLEKWRLPDSSEGVVSISPTGDLYVNLLSAQSSVAHYGGYQWLLPKSVRQSRPRGGIYALSPVSISAQLTVALQWLDTLAANRNTLFLDGIQSQLWSARRILALAIERKELEPAVGRHVGNLLQEAEAGLRQCRSDLNRCESLFDSLRATAEALL
ncbi:PQQ-binding-like beta-propeller repeat protein [Litorivivens sp.]|uniref:outer membrane protein assembly factor BamB family protein n=3 Tax=Litorivivens sp. TaxID=2020868 RepID=UPI0035648A14